MFHVKREEDLIMAISKTVVSIKAVSDFATAHKMDNEEIAIVRKAYLKHQAQLKRNGIQKPDLKHLEGTKGDKSRIAVIQAIFRLAKAGDRLCRVDQDNNKKPQVFTVVAVKANGKRGKGNATLLTLQMQKQKEQDFSYSTFCAYPWVLSFFEIANPVKESK